MSGSIELAGDQTTVPAENGARLGETGDLRKELAAEPSADISKCAPLGVGEPELVGQVRPQNGVLCYEVFALEKEALVHQTCRYASNRAQLFFCMPNQYCNDELYCAPRTNILTTRDC